MRNQDEQMDVFAFTKIRIYAMIKEESPCAAMRILTIFAG